MILKIRIFLFLTLLFPQGLYFFFVYRAAPAVQDFFGQVEALVLASSLLMVFALPEFLTRLLIGRPVERARIFCQAIKSGNYRVKLELPNEKNDGSEEDAFIALMRNLNWMAKQIEIREFELQETVKYVSASRTQLDEKNKCLSSMNEELRCAQQDLEKQKQELHIAYEAMRQMAETDPLTGLSNRRCFFERAEAALQECRKEGCSFTMAMLDIDFFKKINDTYGHDAGDQVLKNVAAVLSAGKRKEDLLARVGGEEFALFLPATEADEAKMILENIRCQMEKQVMTRQEETAVYVTISVGFCCSQDKAEGDLSELYTCSDQALYFSKQHGRNRVAAWPVKKSMQAAGT